MVLVRKRVTKRLIRLEKHHIVHSMLEKLAQQITSGLKASSVDLR